MSMNMADPAVQDMLEEDKREALARIHGAIPTPNELTARIAEAVEPLGHTVAYEHTGGNCGAIGVYRRDAGGMMEPIGAYLLVSGSEGPWPHSSADEPLNAQWDGLDDAGRLVLHGDPDPDWGDFEVFLYSDSRDGREIEALPIASVSGVDALVAAVVAWCKTGAAS